MTRPGLFHHTPSARLLAGCLALLVVLRLLSLAFYPLTDNTEARYAEIGRLMWERGDWVTPWLDRDTPFWGKPPLSFWATALGFGVFGINEFAARLPHFLGALVVGWWVWQWAAQRSSQEALTAVALLGASSLMLLASGAVMTDMFLLLGIALTMRGFWLALHGGPSDQKRESWLFFIGLAIGLLAKGPLMLVLAGLPLGLWTLWRREVAQVWNALPWVRGLALILLLVCPWYLLAELRSPGFLDYFLVGEHWHRFVTPGWAGDKYGGAHQAARGTIWLYALVALLPWSLVLPVAAWFWRQHPRTPLPPDPQASPVGYWVLWALAPALFFTMASNILWTYVLPALPALALLGARWLSGLANQRAVNRTLSACLMLMSAMLVTALFTVNQQQHDDWNTTRSLVTQYNHATRGKTAAPALVFYPLRPYSASFYSRGAAQHIRSPDALINQVSQAPTFLAVKTRAVAQLPARVRQTLTLQGAHGQYSLFLSQPDSAKP